MGGQGGFFTQHLQTVQIPPDIAPLPPLNHFLKARGSPTPFSFFFFVLHCTCGVFAVSASAITRTHAHAHTHTHGRAHILSHACLLCHSANSLLTRPYRFCSSGYGCVGINVCRLVCRCAKSGTLLPTQRWKGAFVKWPHTHVRALKRCACVLCFAGHLCMPLA